MSKDVKALRPLRDQLCTYSLSAAGTLALITPADASIIYSGPVNLTVSAGVDQNLNFTGSGTDLRFYLSTYTGVNLGGAYFSNYQYVAAQGNGAYKANPVAASTLIGPASGAFQTGSYGALFKYEKYTSGPHASDPPFVGGTFSSGNAPVRGFLPVRLNAGSGNFHYGWVDYQPSTDGSTATIFGYAYETGNNVAIAAGAVPEPAESALALGVLALGAAGLHRLRKKRALAGI